jgi:hypothetical protein
MYQPWLLRAEGAAVAAGAIAFAVVRGDSLLLFALLFLAPDLSMLGYLGGRRLGSLTYNAVHTYLGPGALLAVGLVAGVDLAIFGGLLWTAHVGVDRAVGYGLKYADAPFAETHLQHLHLADDHSAASGAEAPGPTE